MKILQVRFRNLNSLAGDWEIDLAHPVFASNGIFAITGPTGAGKTTILDAICLALYGRTPRLNKVTKSVNEVMSRRTGDCFAEVTFETPAGRYRCHWSQHRARKKPGGELQIPKHEIAEADSGKVIEAKIRDVAHCVEKVTGMDFDRFTRSMLLAQGGFSAFLQAAPDARAPILEQITGTGIYSRISIRVHERRREEQEKLNLLQAETAGIVILAPEEEQTIQQAVASAQKEETDLADKSDQTGKAIIRLTAIDALKGEISRLTAEANRLQNDIDAFQPHRDKLRRALRAATLDGAYATLTAMRKQRAKDQAALKREEKSLPELESAARRQAESLKSAGQRSITAKDELKAASPLIQKVRVLDQALSHQEKTISDHQQRCKTDAERIDASQKARIKEQKKRTDAEKNIRRADRYLKEHARDEWLTSGLAGVEEQLASLRAKQEEIAQKAADQKKARQNLERAEKKREDCRKHCRLGKQVLADVSNDLNRGRDALRRLLDNRLLREYRREKETLLREMAFMAKITELEDHRARLEDGKPCPLCGATAHPFAAGNVPLSDETEQKVEALTRRISRAEDQEAAIKKLEAAEATARKNLAKAENKEAIAVNDKKTAGQFMTAVTEDLINRQTGFAELKQNVSARLEPLGMAKIPDNDISSLIDTLKARLDAWQAQARKKADIEKQIRDIDGELKRLDAVIDTQRRALAEKKERLTALQKEYAAGCQDRKRLYGDKCPDDEERSLKSAVSDAGDAEKKAGDRYHEVQQQWNRAKTRVESLASQMDLRSLELKTLEAEFAAMLEPAGFADEAAFLKASLTAAQRDALSAKAKELDHRQTDLQARLTDRKTRLSVEMAGKGTDKSLEDLKAQSKKYEESLRKVRDMLAGLAHKLNENKAAKERIRAKQTAVEAQKKECRRWENLHALIGSADGKKYRNFAQGLTFEMMIGHANGQLQKMTDRYLLVRDDAQPLELNVVDNYQAGEIRSTKNLSGGESFIVSLSLALGLSRMASKNVRVDSLFLDEGFGTLDEAALDTALETLAGLQQNGKLIGIISHVPALKERIHTQIQVTPQTGGRSRISGPGCRKPGTAKRHKSDSAG